MIFSQIVMMDQMNITVVRIWAELREKVPNVLSCCLVGLKV